MNQTKLAAIAIATVLTISTPSFATDHQVQMLNKDSQGRAMQFEPAFLKIAVGDTVTFVPTDKGHNSESIPDLAPAGAEPWKGKMSEQITVTFDQEGFYGFKCLPHFGMGMVGLIQVGDSPTAPDMSKVKMPGKPQQRMMELMSEAGVAPAN